MSIVQYGDRVTVDIVAKTEKGRPVYTSKTGDPIHFQVGRGQLAPVVEEAVLGMKEGQLKQIHLPPERAFGKKIPEFVFDLPKERFAPQMDLTKGKILTLKLSSGEKRMIRIVDARKNRVTVDANHPLAGQEVTLNVTLLAVEKST